MSETHRFVVTFETGDRYDGDVHEINSKHIPTLDGALKVAAFMSEWFEIDTTIMLAVPYTTAITNPPFQMYVDVLLGNLPEGDDATVLMQYVAEQVQAQRDEVARRIAHIQSDVWLSEYAKMRRSATEQATVDALDAWLATYAAQTKE